MGSDVLGVGHIASVQPGLMQGRVTFPVRGEFDLTLDLPHNRTENGHTYRVSRFRCGRDQCDVYWLNVADVDVDMAFWGRISVEGYTMNVAIRPGDSGMTVTFLDTAQPLPIKAEWFAEEAA